jgi:hypothetical protein
MMRLRSLVIAAAIASAPALPVSASAEIVQKSEAGFVMGAELDVPGKTPQDVWQALIAPSGWWNPVHSWSGDAANLYLDPQAGGCFCELLPKPKGAPENERRGSIEHMRVIAAMPPKLLRMTGALGPLQGEALAGTLTVTLKPMPGKGGGTHLAWSYVVGGYMRMTVEEIAPLVDKVMTEQFTRLADAVQASHGAGPTAGDAPDSHPSLPPDTSGDEHR